MVSIITITYNAEKWIETTMRSVLSQTNTDYEYLIIDGASKDNTVAIARQLEPDFRGRLRIYSEPDDGLYYAMNKGLHLAKGDFVWFMNAGDQIFAPETLQQIADQIKPDVDIVYGKASIVNAQGVKVSEHHKKTPEHLTRRSLLNGLVVSHQAILVRRAIAMDYDTRYRITADYDWVVKCVTASRGNMYLDEYLCKFLTDGVSAKQRKRAWIERYKIMRQHYGLVQTLIAHLLIVIKYPFSIKY